MRIKFEDMLNEFKRILMKKGFDSEDATLSARILAENSLDGVYSHGVNRFPKVIEYIDKGYIDVKAKPEKIDGFASFERWDGKRGMGNLNARMAMYRATELAREYGVGILALGNTNHWMRGGTYGWQAANAGFIGICWTNTMPNMPAWGGKDRRIGNNPLVMAIPRKNGEHVVLDTAMSQFSYGKIEEHRLRNEKLPVPGGYDYKGNLTNNPFEIEETWRVLPIGFWKGSSISIALDLIVAVLSGGYSTTDIGKKCESEYALSQMFIAIDPYRFSSTHEVESTIDNVIKDIKDSEKAESSIEVRYPGERVISTRRDNLENGIPVVKSIWEKIKAF